MKPYSEFRPTGADIKGLNLPDRQDWLVGPVTINRDSGILAESNWHVVTEDIKANGAEDGDYPDWEIHRFGHWACGWFELILVRPDSDAAKCAEEWESALADYPVASDEDLSERETVAIYEEWEFLMTLKDRVKMISECGGNIMAARHVDRIPDNVQEKLRNRLYQN